MLTFAPKEDKSMDSTGLKKAKVELGKWLLDIAKYMTTALLLSSVFTDMNEPVVWVVVLLTVFVILILGLNLIGKNAAEKETAKNKKRR